MRRQRALFLIALLAASLVAQSAAAGTFPTGPVRITSIFPVGSGPDTMMRTVAERMAAAWSRPVVIEPKPGASGFIAAAAVKGAPPTGHDLLLADVGVLTTNQALFKRLPYDTVRDFVPVAMLYRTSFMIAVSATGPYKSVADLVAAARTPDKISYVSSGSGGPMHLGAAQLEAATGTHMLHVPFKDLGAGLSAVVSGEVSWLPVTMLSAGPLVKAGRLKLLAVLDAKRNPSAPDVPTLAEAGGPTGVEATAWVALMAPARTPAATVGAINRAINAALQQPAVIARFRDVGFEPAVATPAELGELIRTDSRRNAELVKRTGASVD